MRLYASNNNAEWIELAVEGLVESLSIQSYPIVLIQPANSEYRYWKVHYSGPGQSRFSNYLEKFVRLYGFSARKDER